MHALSDHRGCTEALYHDLGERIAPLPLSSSPWEKDAIQSHARRGEEHCKKYIRWNSWTDNREHGVIEIHYRCELPQCIAMASSVLPVLLARVIETKHRLVMLHCLAEVSHVLP